MIDSIIVILFSC